MSNPVIAQCISIVGLFVTISKHRSHMILVYFTENIAFEKSAWQNTTRWTGFGAVRAVDGRKRDLSWYGGHCAVTEVNQSKAEWRVDLGGVSTIHHIVILYMTDNIAWGTELTNKFVFTWQV